MDTGPLVLAQAKGESIPGAELFQWKKGEQFRDDVTLMKGLVDDVIRQRRSDATRAPTTPEVGLPAFRHLPRTEEAPDGSRSATARSARP